MELDLNSDAVEFLKYFEADEPIGIGVPAAWFHVKQDITIQGVDLGRGDSVVFSLETGKPMIYKRTEIALFDKAKDELIEDMDYIKKHIAGLNEDEQKDFKLGFEDGKRYAKSVIKKALKKRAKEQAKAKEQQKPFAF